MIIKSLGRKSTQEKNSHTRVFQKLIRYMNKGIEQENGKAILWHNFGGMEHLNEAQLQNEFETNAEHLKDRKNGNILYHEILSFSFHERHKNIPDIERQLTDIGQEYLRQRAPNQLAYGVIHRDTDHLHLHLMISANALANSKRIRLSKSQFKDIQKQLEHYTLTRHSELQQTRIYDKDPREKNREKIKTQTHEQAMKSRTGQVSNKEKIKAKLHQIFEQSKNRKELERHLQENGYILYSRGKNTGIKEQSENAKERKYRFSTLGLQEHYERTQNRFLGRDGQDLSTGHVDNNVDKSLDNEKDKYPHSPEHEKQEESQAQTKSKQAEQAKHPDQYTAEELKAFAHNFLQGKTAPEKDPQTPEQKKQSQTEKRIEELEAILRGKNKDRDDRER